MTLMKTKDNKDRNETILNSACEFLEMMNVEIENAFVEDVDPPRSEASAGQDKEIEQVLVSLTVSKPGALIGFKGRNLVAFQQLLGLIVKNKLGRWVRVLVDVNNYRTEQKERLSEMAINLAKKAGATGEPVSMMNMSSYERRICHMAVKEVSGVVSESEGEGESRHVVIRPA